MPFAQVTVEDPTRPQGKSVVTTAGVVGTRTLVCDVTRLRGAELSRTLISDTITTPPVDEVTSLGTYVAPAPEPVPFAGTGGNCDPNYEGACVRIDSDVDCAGGSGNGPSYVSGPVYVVGSDIYQLDRDGDGVGCE
ncbi:MAG: G5 domain-containing protein [Phycicoccus sp.]|nr:G5 domain-containing protein [Phycicoccus sp.]